MRYVVLTAWYFLFKKHCGSSSIMSVLEISFQAQTRMIHGFCLIMSSLSNSGDSTRGALIGLSLPSKNPISAKHAT